ncbi:MAG: hypothetical protein ABI882_17670, partial [Acidobacteriota bacterium]
MTASNGIHIRSICAVLLLQAAFQAHSIAGYRTSPIPSDDVRKERVAPGIEHLEITRVRDDGTERWLINVLDVDPA